GVFYRFESVIVFIYTAEYIEVSLCRPRLRHEATNLQRRRLSPFSQTAISAGDHREGVGLVGGLANLVPNRHVVLASRQVGGDNDLQGCAIDVGNVIELFRADKRSR
ncbi:hypothetical protein LCGC14_1758180, partial [marine sediment metagenome]